MSICVHVLFFCEMPLFNLAKATVMTCIVPINLYYYHMKQTSNYKTFNEFPARKFRI